MKSWSQCVGHKPEVIVSYSTEPSHTLSWPMLQSVPGRAWSDVVPLAMNKVYTQTEHSLLHVPPAFCLSYCTGNSTMCNESHACFFLFPISIREAIYDDLMDKLSNPV